MKEQEIDNNQESIDLEQEDKQEGDNYVTLDLENEKLTQEVKELKTMIENIKEQQKKLMLATKVNTLKDQEIRNEEFKKYAKQRMIEDSILPLLLNFERALNFKTDNKEIKNFLVGFQFIFDELKNTLNKEGLSTLTVKNGDMFDSHICEVVETQEITHETKDHKDNMIVKVLSTGYKLHNRVVSPSKVKIVKVKIKEEK